MPKKLLHGIDVAAPGGVQKLLDFHRKTFGDSVMEENSEAITAPAGENNGQSNEFKPPASQADLDRIVQDRVARVHTQYAGFDDFKAKAEKVDEFQTRIGTLETENGELSTKVQGFEAATERAEIVSDISKATGVPANVLRGSTREDLQAHADELKEAYRETAPVIQNQERTPGNTSGNPDKEFVRRVFGND